MLRTTGRGVLGITSPSSTWMGRFYWTRLAASSKDSPSAAKPRKSTSPSSQTVLLLDPAGELCGAKRLSALLQQFLWHNPTCAMTPDQINYVSFWWRRTCYQFSHMRVNIPDAWKFPEILSYLSICLFIYSSNTCTHLVLIFNTYCIPHSQFLFFKISLVFSIVRQWWQYPIRFCSLLSAFPHIDAW